MFIGRLAEESVKHAGKKKSWQERIQFELTIMPMRLFVRPAGFNDHT
jgi:hypothetical protein